MDDSSILDLATSGGNPIPGGSPAQTNAPGAPSAPPDILTLLAKIQGTSLPTLPQPSQQEQDALGPLALLQFAASVAAPKAYGQSNMSAFMNAAGTAASGYMANKKQMEDQAIAKGEAQRKMAASDAQIAASRASTLSSVAQTQQQLARGPLELKALQQGIDKSSNELELQNYSKRLAALHDKYAEQEIQAGLDEKSAKTDAERAQASMERSHAQYWGEAAKDMLLQIDAKRAAANRPSYTAKEGLPGEPSKIVDSRTGAAYNQPMEPAAALDFATRQVEAQIKAGEVQASDKKSAIQRAYQMYRKGNVPSMQEGPAAPSGLPTGATDAQNVTPTDDNAAKALAAKSGQPVVNNKSQTVFMPDGSSMPRARYNELVQQRSGPPSAVPAQPAAPAPASGGYTPPPDSMAAQARSRQQAALAAREQAQQRDQQAQQHAVTEAAQLAANATSTKDRVSAQLAMRSPGFASLPQDLQAQVYKIANGVR